MYCVLCTVYCVLCTVYCVLCTVYCVLCTVYCVLCTGRNMGNRLCSHASKNLTPVACFPVHKCIEKIVNQRVICGGQKCKIPSAMVSQAKFFCSTRQKKFCCHLFWTFRVEKTGGKRKKSKKSKFPPLHSITHELRRARDTPKWAPRISNRAHISQNLSGQKIVQFSRLTPPLHGRSPKTQIRTLFNLFS